MMLNIPLYQPSLSGREKEYVLDCLESSWISSKGKYVKQFEENFAKKIDVLHATSVCSGTAALHLALLALGIGPGDDVIVPTFTYIASVNAITYTGATPVFVDALPNTWQMDPADVRRKITARTRALMVVHLYGHPCDMEALMSIAESHKMFIVEDCAESFGAFYQGRHVGGFGQVATFSFYGNKTITTGEGGMCVTNDEALYKRAVHFKEQGSAANRHYWHDLVGYNYRMTNLCAALGVAQLEQADEFIGKKRQLAKWYREALRGLPIEMHEEDSRVTHSYWMVSILVDDAQRRDAVRDHLTCAGVETRPFFYPVHTMPMYTREGESHPVAVNLSSRGINLPSWPGLARSDIDRICSLIAECHG